MEENKNKNDVVNSENDFGSGLLLSVETLKEIKNQYTLSQSDGGDTDGSDSSDGND